MLYSVGMKGFSYGLLVLWACFVAMTCPLYGQQRLEVGSQAPAWTDLVGTDDQKHSLADLQDYDYVVVCFTCNTCPYAIDYEDRLISLHQHFQDLKSPKVAVVAINANDTPDDQLEKMKERAEQKQFPFLYLRDENHQVAKDYKALYTPEFFVLDRARKIQYQGALDNKTKAEEVTQQYVVEIIELLAKGQAPTTTYQPARGCKIRFPKPKRDLE